MEKHIVRRYLTPANIITILRIVMIPLIVYFLIINRELLSFFVFLVAISTDLLDGYIARTFNQVTYLGMVLDPLADKLIQVTVLTTLACLGFSAWSFAVLLLIKEGLTILVAIVIYIKYKMIVKANQTGKIASVVVNIGISLSFFHAYLSESLIPLDFIALSMGILLAYIAMIIYMINITRALKGEKIEYISRLDNLK